MRREDIERELELLRERYDKIERMSDEEAQREMNCDDSKDTILMYIHEDMDELMSELEELNSDYDGGYHVDPAFRSWSDFYSMVV